MILRCGWRPEKMTLVSTAAAAHQREIEQQGDKGAGQSRNPLRRYPQRSS
jgi:hypothetical protein